MKWIKVAIGAVIAISVIPVIVTSVTALTEVGGDLEGSVAGTLLDLAPLVFVASVLAFLFTKTGSVD
jgi:uncharacterized PurR-regulated membrane protein YhhQ (DUF165 family)